MHLRLLKKIVQVLKHDNNVATIFIYLAGVTCEYNTQFFSKRDNLTPVRAPPAPNYSHASRFVDAVALSSSAHGAATELEALITEGLQLRLNQPLDAPFTGSLGSKNRPDLQEIAGALGLPETGMKEALTQSIKSHFDA